MRRLLAWLGVIVIVLGIILGVLDRVGVHYAEQQVAKNVSTELASRNITSAPPEVTITGFPFLTQVAAGNYDEIQLNLRDLKGGTLPLPLLQVHAYDVRATVEGLRNGTEKAVATLVNGTGTLSYADLVEVSGLEGVTLIGDGSVLRVTGNAGVAGQLKGAAKVTVVDGKVRIQVTELTASNLAPIAQQLVNTYKDRLARTFEIPPLPFNMKLQSVNPAPSGLEISVTAKEVELG
ncbi:hypothetical protein Rhe02_93980 [Rhizocola hellebori]|uniref:DUF2993 domain-containing protein n=1 Tax=Rhizocola hellebori TaxID=1392758 RepID=A0A8J3QLP1_9ACTN|nr:DUF2993 domain-containing protein [Rhizocola hellebori]GIH11331.1 hypothetical protein Rhe02_93980 [Rhizocola hellebori]